MILIIVNIFYTSFLDDFSPSFAIAVYIRHIHHPGKYIWKLPGTAVFIYVFSSFIQTILSVLESHQISCFRITPCPEDIVILLSLIICIAL